MELKSMVDFVLEQNIKHNGEYTGVEMTDLLVTLYGNIVRYANFLNQPLTLSMFIPGGDDGEVLEEPSNYKEWNKKECAWWENYTECLEYQQAKKRCLFEGFELKNTHNLETENPCYVVSNGENEVTFHIGLYNFSKGVKFAKTIEDLVPISPAITQSAINQITTTR